VGLSDSDELGLSETLTDAVSLPETDTLEDTEAVLDGLAP